MIPKRAVPGPGPSPMLSENTTAAIRPRAATVAAILGKAPVSLLRMITPFANRTICNAAPPQAPPPIRSFLTLGPNSYEAPSAEGFSGQRGARGEERMANSR